MEVRQKEEGRVKRVDWKKKAVSGNKSE